MNLLNDTFKVVVPNDWCDDNSKHGANMCQEDQVGHYKKILDESVQSEKDAKSGKMIKNRDRGALWK